MRLGSIVIPAYNEGRVISRCLSALRETGLDVEIVVAANGCVDDTVARAREFTGVTVLDLPTPSKSGALNEGDAAATAFPRIYLDADIVLGPDALAGMLDTLAVERPLVAAPSARFATAGAGWAVRQYYAVYTRTPYVTDGLVGLGVYGLSKAGRARFERFPQLTADDLFIQRLFAPTERRTTPGWFEVQAPRSLHDLVEVRTRVARGNAELARAALDCVGGLPSADYSATTASTVGALTRLAVGAPRLIPGAAVYLGVVAAGRIRARTSTSGTWNRDESTR